MVDAVIGGGIVLLTVYGMWRGFFREVVAVGALVGATAAAARWAPALGSPVATQLGASAEIGYMAAGAAIWVLAYLSIQIVGRTIFNRLKRAPDEERGLLGAARGAVASLAATIDRVLGAALGLAKGGLVAMLVLFLAVDLQVPALRPHFQGTRAARLYRSFAAPLAERLPEVRVARSLGTLRKVRKAIREDPSRFERLARHPAVQELWSHPPLRALVGDVELRQHIRARRFDLVLQHDKVIGLLKDRDTMRKLADIPIEAILADVEADAPPLWLYPDPEDSAAEVGLTVAADSRYAPGRTVTGRVRLASAEGIYVDLDDDTDGLIRAGDVAWSDLGVPLTALFAEGAEVAAEVLAAGPEPEHGKLHLALGRKQLEDDPWTEEDVPAALPLRSEQVASVRRIGPGAILFELGDGVEAAIPHEGFARWKLELLRPGSRVDVRVSELDEPRRVLRIRARGDERGE